jgi:hypothetical protein
MKNLTRTRNLVVRLTNEELVMAHRIASASDESVARVIRRLIKIAYVDRFGIEADVTR